MPYLIAIVIGLLVGIEREKAHPNQKTMGVRTFLLISLLGAIAGGLENPWFALVLAIFTLSLILISYFTQTNTKDINVDRGLTTEFAAGIIFCLGYAAHQNPAISAIIGPIVALILFSKTSLHRFTKNIKPSELEAALLLLLGGVIVVNLVPDAVIDPWGIFNPKQFGFLVLTLATLEFSSYALAKIVGEKKGSLVYGFLGGLVSSTAVFLSSAQQVEKSPQNWRTYLSSTIAAKLAALLEVILIVGIISPTLLAKVSIIIGPAILFGALAVYIIAKRNVEASLDISIKTPLDWKGVFRLSITLAAILALITVVKLWLGDNATLIVSFITGLFELHGVTIANATMFTQNQLNPATVGFNISLAAIASMVAKITMSWFLHRGPFTKAVSLVFTIMILLIALIEWLLVR